MNSIFLKIYLPNLIVCVRLLFLVDFTLYMPATVITASQVYNINTKAADSRSETCDTNTSTRKISPLNYFVLGKNSPAYKINTHLQTYKAFSTCPRVFGTDF